MLYRDINTGPRPSDELLSSELFTPTDVLIDARDQIVGNPGGLQLLSRLDKLEAKLLAMHQENLADSDLSFNIRKATLDDWSGHVDPNDAQLEREVRNEQVHGGSIAKDVAVIAAYEGKARGSLWKDAFQVSYGVNYDAMKHVIKNVPDEILVILNRRCSAKRLASWQKKRGSQAKKIIEYADDAISVWAQRPETSFCTGSRGYELMRLIEDLWHGD